MNKLNKWKPAAEISFEIQIKASKHCLSLEREREKRDDWFAKK